MFPHRVGQQPITPELPDFTTQAVVFESDSGAATQMISGKELEKIRTIFGWILQSLI